MEGTEFAPVYSDNDVKAEKVKKVLFCNGQFYYDIKNRREELKRDVKIIIFRMLLLLESSNLLLSLMKQSKKQSLHTDQMFNTIGFKKTMKTMVFGTLSILV